MNTAKLAQLILGLGKVGSKAHLAAQVPTWFLPRSGSRNGGGTWKRMFCSQPPGSTRTARAPVPGNSTAVEGPAAQAAAAAGKSPFAKYMEELRSVPAMPLFLGFAGALPFICLSPPIMKQLKKFLPIPSDVFHQAAVLQVGYAACIVSFLGAVHWGAALSSKLSGPIALKIANERYSWSVLPCLLAWPTTAMEPGPASLILGLLLPVVYAVDSRFHKLGYLPRWYMTLRGPLTALASFGMLTSAIYFLELENERASRRAAAAAAAAAAVAATKAA